MLFRQYSCHLHINFISQGLLVQYDFQRGQGVPLRKGTIKGLSWHINIKFCKCGVVKGEGSISRYMENKTVLSQRHNQGYH